MKYLIASVASALAVILTIAAIFCAYKAFTQDITWGFVMLGLVLPDAVALLIAQAAFHAVKDW